MMVQRLRRLCGLRAALTRYDQSSESVAAQGIRISPIRLISFALISRVRTPPQPSAPPPKAFFPLAIIIQNNCGHLLRAPGPVRVRLLPRA